jgi:hypothetical protein
VQIPYRAGGEMLLGLKTNHSNNLVATVPSECDFHHISPEFALIKIGWGCPDLGAPMIDLIDNRTLLIVGCTALILAGNTGVIWAVFLARREEARRRQLVAASEVARDWEPTWKINAVTDGCG